MKKMTRTINLNPILSHVHTSQEPKTPQLKTVSTAINPMLASMNERRRLLLDVEEARATVLENAMLESESSRRSKSQLLGDFEEDEEEAKSPLQRGKSSTLASPPVS